MLASDEETVAEPVLPLASAVVQPAVATTESRTSMTRSLLRSESMCCYSLQGWWL
jgi:hypothetical protein